MPISDLPHFERVLKRIGAALAALPPPEPRKPSPVPSFEALSRTFEDLRQPLKVMREAGGGINFWAFTGIKQKEVLNCAVLAGLWSYEFGGRVSRSFLAAYLDGAFPDVEWELELKNGYRIRKELNPLGDSSDRLDLFVETSKYLVAIEVKINAQLDEYQISRYVEAVTQRALESGKKAKVATLTRRKNFQEGTVSTTWREISRAATISIFRSDRQISPTEHLILSFGQYSANFR